MTNEISLARQMGLDGAGRKVVLDIGVPGLKPWAPITDADLSTTDTPEVIELSNNTPDTDLEYLSDEDLDLAEQIALDMLTEELVEEYALSNLVHDQVDELYARVCKGSAWAKQKLRQLVAENPDASDRVLELKQLEMAATYRDLNHPEGIEMATYVDSSGRRVELDDKPTARHISDPASLPDTSQYAQRTRLEDAFGELPQWQQELQAEQDEAASQMQRPDMQEWLLRARTDPSQLWRESRDHEGRHEPHIEAEVERQRAAHQGVVVRRLGDDDAGRDDSDNVVYRGDRPDLEDFVARARREMHQG